MIEKNNIPYILFAGRTENVLMIKPKKSAVLKNNFLQFKDKI